MEDAYKNKILNRILKESKGKDLLDSLVNLSNSDLQSLLLEVFSKRSTHIDGPQLLRAYRQNPFVQPAAISVTESLAMDIWLFKLLPEAFEFLELSPLSPFGTCSAMGTVSQNKVISALKGTEVVADATNVLAYECAVRRQNLLNYNPGDSQNIHLASSHRLIRNQSMVNQKHSPHFRIIGLCSAGRDIGNKSFEIETLALHLNYYQQVLNKLNKEGHFKFEVQLTFWSGLAKKTQEIITEELQKRLPNLKMVNYPQRSSGQSYYPQGCFQIELQFEDTNVQIVDGGFTNWTQSMLNNKKERLLISGMGTELMMKLIKS